MNQETWTLINRKFERFRSYRAESIDETEFDKNYTEFYVTSDYREFVLRFGGAFVGAYPIYGLRLAEAMGTISHKKTAPEITRAFRERKWPGVENWLVFSIDQSGNPIGLAADGSVWISDSARDQIQRLAKSFEEFLLTWGLRIGESR